MAAPAPAAGNPIVASPDRAVKTPDASKPAVGDSGEKSSLDVEKFDLPPGSNVVDGELAVKVGTIRSREKVSVPFRADFVVKTDSNDIRIGYGARGSVTFNWKVRPQVLRFEDPIKPGFSEVPGKGSVPVNQFVKITWINDVDELRILVDGEERVRTRGDYHNLSEQLSIRPAFRSQITIKSISITSKN